MIKLCIAGKNNIAVNSLEYILKNHFKPDQVAVIPNKNDFGVDSWQKSLLHYAFNNHIKVITLEEAYELKQIIFFSLEFDRIVKVEKFKSDKLFNMHFSALPKYKGVFTSITPILNNEVESGVTLHCIDNGIDTGNIIDQYIFPININDTARDLYFNYLSYGEYLFKKNIQRIINNTYENFKQNNISSSYFSRQDININHKINFKKTSFEIHNQIRAFIFKEYQLPSINKTKIIKSTLTNEFIGYNMFEEFEEYFMISGIDGFKIIAQKYNAELEHHHHHH
uniref:Formyl_trans_N domain-containing protein n=1 Tax=Helicobacter canadensis MIT 98-5491 TaxID=537970 RepID=UPI001C12CF10|nr:Chain A, Formyl_trans_N domain-containing protein [Helicobacter canadensis MIT 98-5491]7N7A_B Chain B, Formyl_trans_N domain-containing protein [Helicobacter canadensis MIT 98-5491]7N7B_A Chain A, Formyl_trans_N domain-containing protein [Helicobacter canadensis MIT 98-5491]7N7B_B Chain B, Formyl_trans_N domain-containing protein [Helicobacter canadensis MIT 98-5491]7N7C_A Chain A, Formyl_trans_N domain-containing protein [Helicobacter canadensis MIT 98-5491]7N7C_B Chain B, Formyl_trans_N d